jgi:hypothetical protein
MHNLKFHMQKEILGWRLYRTCVATFIKPRVLANPCNQATWRPIFDYMAAWMVVRSFRKPRRVESSCNPLWWGIKWSCSYGCIQGPIPPDVWIAICLSGPVAQTVAWVFLAKIPSSCLAHKPGFDLGSVALEDRYATTELLRNTWIWRCKTQPEQKDLVQIIFYLLK